MSQEIWKDVKGYEGTYQVSNLGNVRSLDKIVKRNKQGNFLMKGLLMAQTIRSENSKYLCIGLSKNKKCKVFSVHRLVAIAFIPKVRGKNYVNHLDGIKKNNCVDNLEWCTRSENAQHAHKNGMINVARGERSGNAKTTEKEVRDLRKLSKFFNNRELAVIFDMLEVNVSRIKNRKRWKHVQ